MQCSSHSVDLNSMKSDIRSNVMKIIGDKKLVSVHVWVKSAQLQYRFVCYVCCS